MNRANKIIGCAVLTLAGLWIMSAYADETRNTGDAPAAVASKADKPAAPESVPATSGDTVLVKVDDQPVTQADLDAEIVQIQKMMKNRGIPQQQFEAMLKNIKPQILDGLIVRKLISRECDKEKITASPEEIAKEIENFQATLPKKTTLDDFLKQSGITRENFNRDVGEQVKIEKLLKVVPPTDAEIKAYYDENKSTYFEMPETVSARHILIQVKADDDSAKKDAKKKKAEDLRKKLNKGDDFAKLAEEHSDCPSKAKGGKLEAFARGHMVPAFEEAAFSLKTNEISGVVETEFGYHIIQTLEHNPAQTKSLDEVKSQIAFRLKNKKMQEALETLVKQLKGSAKIEYQKAGEALKVSAPPEGSFPMMPAPSKDKDEGKEKSSEKSDKSEQKSDTGGDKKP